MEIKHLLTKLQHIKTWESHVIVIAGVIAGVNFSEASGSASGWRHRAVECNNGDGVSQRMYPDGRLLRVRLEYGNEDVLVPFDNFSLRDSDATGVEHSLQARPMR